MRVLLTGGYGCIGSWIVKNLLERGDQALIYDLKEDPHCVIALDHGDRVGRFHHRRSTRRVGRSSLPLAFTSALTLVRRDQGGSQTCSTSANNHD